MKLLDLVKLENKLKKIIRNKIGILGGTFDPAHIGHVKISKEAKKRFKLNKIFWIITKKNPFKKNSLSNLKKRINFAKKINHNNKFIKIYYYEDKIKSNRTFNLIKFLKKKYKNTDFFFIMGADNLINFHKWKKWKKISNMCKILVFDRNYYKSRSLKSISYKKLNKNRLKFINFEKINISSSQLRKI
jgi:nicotinate-nucleotide adenylyltransferase